ncbi:MAG: SIS domain-containing protein [Anaerolineae bacterium]|uniref:SIS domain-containing protein n=1 Tax=Thermoflexus sp. TaxID=1969742 RepID=UPI0025DCFE7D|nr:SIS domain-containing protein [Thermoflexus sp.]MCS7351485.1 SIS domain-containing protein [Thermoflexus sp.]MDW8180942.1 SIS domain-containing protein [Anaerolineae bacterium]
MSWIRYREATIDQLQRAFEANRETIPLAARLIAEAVAGDRILHVFGSGHSQLVALDIAGRAGGFANVNPIFDPLFGRAERLEGFVSVLLSAHTFHPGDVLIVISHSGRNPAPIEVALHGKQHGLPVIAVTAVAFSRSLPSRHSSGKRLFEIADVILDTLGAPGDAVIPLDADLSVGPTSTVIGAALLQAVISEAAAQLLNRGVRPPLFRSGNLEGADAYNQELRSRYRGRVTLLI